MGGVDPSSVVGLSEFDEMHFPAPEPPAEADELRCVECDRRLIGPVCTFCETRPQPIGFSGRFRRGEMHLVELTQADDRRR
ncbi:MAG: hypothetical protein AAGF23_24385, partial [Acidobacteriota bacterium]